MKIVANLQIYKNDLLKKLSRINSRKWKQELMCMKIYPHTS